MARIGAEHSACICAPRRSLSLQRDRIFWIYYLWAADDGPAASDAERTIHAFASRSEKEAPPLTHLETLCDDA